MADIVGLEAFYDERDISGIAVGATPVAGGEIHERRPLNATIVRKVGGLANYGLQVSGSGDWDGATWQDLFNDTMGDHNFMMPFHVGSFGTAASEGDPCWIARGVSGGPQTTARNGDLFEWTLELNPQPLVFGFVLARGTKTTSGNSASGILYTGGIAAGQTAYAFLTVPTATSGTIDVTIESDATDTFGGAETTRFTFTQVTTTATSQLMTLAGPVTDTYWRAVWTSAATPSHNIAVGMGIL